MNMYKHQRNIYCFYCIRMGRFAISARAVGGAGDSPAAQRCFAYLSLALINQILELASLCHLIGQVNYNIVLKQLHMGFFVFFLLTAQES